ncbi:phage tail tube protein [Paenibacillus oleatilyticus]|uniref:phage tail tube protein n=1 Tax=Paenibacillus oleatilyticus TaxID=2594886 RepID=UPI001C1FADD1|nr:phage tail tube protein [Paenibacillus oleatilyticus]MBU7320276.1 phage tail tube protein [Paenibacillus oleatilyticus]
MARPDPRRVINGTYGRLWVNGELWAEVDSFEAKATINYEDVNFAGEGATFKKATGWAGEGSMTIKKVYSRVQRIMADGIRNGTYPRLELVGKVADPDAFGTERVALHDVTVNEMLLLKFEQKTLGSEEVPFAFSDYEMMDTITPR